MTPFRRYTAVVVGCLLAAAVIRQGLRSVSRTGAYDECGRNYPIRWELGGTTQRETDMWSTPGGFFGLGYNLATGCGNPTRAWEPTDFTPNGTTYAGITMKYDAAGRQSVVLTNSTAQGEVLETPYHTLYSIRYNSVFTPTKLFNLDWPWVARPSVVEFGNQSGADQKEYRYTYDSLGRATSRATIGWSGNTTDALHWRYRSRRDVEAYVQWTDSDAGGTQISLEVDKERRFIRRTFQWWVDAPGGNCSQGFSCKNPGPFARTQECLSLPCDQVQTQIDTHLDVDFDLYRASKINITKIHAGEADPQVQTYIYNDEGRFTNQTFNGLPVVLGQYLEGGRPVGLFNFVYVPIPVPVGLYYELPTTGTRNDSALLNAAFSPPSSLRHPPRKAIEHLRLAQIAFS